MFTPWNACPLVPCNGRRAKHIPLGPAPWNSFSACLLPRNDRIGGDHLDLLSRGYVIPPGREVHHESGGFTLWNAKHNPLGLTPWNAEQISLGSYQLWTDHKDPVSQNESGVFYSKNKKKAC